MHHAGEEVANNRGWYFSWGVAHFVGVAYPLGLTLVQTWLTASRGMVFMGEGYSRRFEVWSAPFFKGSEVEISSVSSDPSLGKTCVCVCVCVCDESAAEFFFSTRANMDKRFVSVD